MEAQVLSFGFENFMGFAEPVEFSITSIALIFGRNSSGKSAIFRLLLMLKQSMNTNGTGPLVTYNENGTDLGTFRNFIYGHDCTRQLTVSFKVFMGDKKHPDHLDEDTGETIWSDFYDWAQKEWAVTSDWATMHLKFAYQNSKIVLNELKVESEYQRKISDDAAEIRSCTLLSAVKNDSPEDQFEIWSFGSDVMDELDTDLWKGIMPDVSNGFLPIIKIKDQAQLNQEGREDSDYQAYTQARDLVRKISECIKTFVQNIYYLGPVRPKPKRFYYAPLIDAKASRSGDDMISAYISSEWQNNTIKLDKLNSWLKKAGLNCKCEIDAVDEQLTLFTVSIIELEKSEQLKSNIKDVGFGLSQVLPVIFAILLAKKGDTILIEQPELHLHPRAQAELANIFVEIFKHEGIRFIIETHSEHIFLRLRRWVAESTAYKLKKDLTNGNNIRQRLPISNDLFLTKDECQVYYIERTANTSSVFSLGIDNAGEVSGAIPDSFEDFFSDDLLEGLAILRAGI